MRKLNYNDIEHLEAGQLLYFIDSGNIKVPIKVDKIKNNILYFYDYEFKRIDYVTAEEVKRNIGTFLILENDEDELQVISDILLL